MPPRKPALPPSDWGAEVVRPAREALLLTRRALAVLCGVSESAIRNVERGRHAPTYAVSARLCRALGLRSPLAGAELRLFLGPLSHNEAIQTLRGALREYIAARADAQAFADLLGAQGIDRELALLEAISTHDTAAQLLALFPDERKEPK